MTELPENFGNFKALKSLDLYANRWVIFLVIMTCLIRLEKLPVSFAQLKHLKWLDLKDNPLCPALKQAAGDCITPNDCALCAKKVVALLQSMESQLQRERQRRFEEEERGKREQERREEAEREKVGNGENYPQHIVRCSGETGQTRRQGEAEGGGSDEGGEWQDFVWSKT